MSRLRPGIVWGGVACGVMDLAAAYFILWRPRGLGAIAGLQGIARALIGATAASNGGVLSAALGLAIHFFIAFCAATVYVVSSRALRILTAQAILCGLLYGVVVYLFMYGVVLRAKFGNVPLTPTGIVIHMFCVGLPIALAARYAK
ncbi:MAG TPA: hypothetical protein VEU08_03390 [Vicinamibacterales bacterium]|nr:hypothetical protein [Vicinamibacterales bacterium]